MNTSMRVHQIAVGRKIALALVLLMLIGLCFSRADELDDYVKRQMQHYEIPGLSLAVVKNGKLVKAKGYGLADVELNAPATKDTVYEIGSVTKVFTATAVMILVNDGRIGLDDKITGYLSDLPPDWGGITVKHLLTHTSGITNDYAAETKYIGRRAPLSAQAVLRSTAASPLNSEPGQKLVYSNTGYYLLGLIVEKVSGKSYAGFMKERIFMRSGMSSTRVNDREAIIPNRAHGYALNRSGGLRNNDYMDASWPFSAGAIVSSVADLARWDAALYTDKLLPQERLKEMETPATLNDGSAIDYMGFGWGINSRPRHGRGVSHFGQTPGFMAGVARWTDQRLTVIVLANKEEFPMWDIVDRVVRIYLPFLNDPIRDDDADLTKNHKKLFDAMMAGTLDSQLFTATLRQTFFPKTAAQLREQTKGLGAIKSFVLVEQGANKRDHYTYRRYRVSSRKQELRFYVESDDDGKISDFRIARD